MMNPPNNIPANVYVFVARFESGTFAVPTMVIVLVPVTDVTLRLPPNNMPANVSVFVRRFESGTFAVPTMVIVPVPVDG